MSDDDRHFSYDSIATEYAAKVDQAPFNAYYERPAMMAMLPDVVGRPILDAGCGSGWYSEQLLQHGAIVDAIDDSAEMVELARQRLSLLSPPLSDRVTVVRASLGDRLPFKAEKFAGAVSPLVLHYLSDWRPALAEIHRVPQPAAWLQFSTHHPAADAALFGTQDYFAVERVRDEWWVGEVEFYRRPLTDIFASLRDTGFQIEEIVEPAPTEELRNVDREAYDRILRQPQFLIVRATRIG